MVESKLIDRKGEGVVLGLGRELECGMTAQELGAGLAWDTWMWGTVFVRDSRLLGEMIASRCQGRYARCVSKMLTVGGQGERKGDKSC